MDRRRQLKRQNILRTKGAGAAKLADRKAELARRSKVKKQFRKLLEKEGVEDGMGVGVIAEEEDDVPSFYVPDVAPEQEAGEDDVNEDGEDNVNEEEETGAEDAGSARRAPQRNPRKQKDVLKGVKGGKVQKQSSKPNPFRKLMDKAAKEKAERHAAFEEEKKRREEASQQRKDYYEKRNQTRSKLNRKTKKGQPVMANLVSHLLEKIQT
ncbi:hypothetical protein HK104_000714 [Borealophlyctis nickersoniae]|nr:hypothetical protein HK104_000714 [Borealophlyctis nickersoniae]